MVTQNALSISISLTSAEAAALYEALSNLPSSEVLSILRECLRPFIPGETEFSEMVEEPNRFSDPAPFSGTNIRNAPAGLPPCPQNGRALVSNGQWRASGSFSRVSNPTSNLIILALASVRYQSPLDGLALWIQSVRELLTSDTESFDGSDLSTVIACCHALSKKDVAGQFLSMLSSIQLAFKCQECVRPLLLPCRL